MTRAFWVFAALVVAVALLSALGAVLSALVSPAVGSLVVAIGWAALAVLAIWDGARRLSGRPSLLGNGTRLGRVLALVQVLLGLVVLLLVLSA